MTLMKSILAIAIVAFSAEVSAEVTFIPNFPVDAQEQPQSNSGSAVKHDAQQQAAPVKNAL